MSRIDELINELCPDGVEFLLLGDICEIKTGKGITKKDSTEDGEFPIISGGKEPMGMYHSANRQANTVTISRVGANAGFVNFIDVDFYLNDKCFSVIPLEKYKKKLDSKFLYEYLKNSEQKITDMQSEGGVPTINTQKVSSIAVPVPPLEVQSEIVRVLDSFTLLTAELTAELTARRKQYEYYKNVLLNNSVYEKKKLGEVCTVQAGGTPSKQNSDFWEGGTIPWLASTVCKNKKNVDSITNYITELGLQKSSAKMMRKGTTLVALVGATIGKLAFLNEEASINQNVAGIYPNDEKELLPDFVYYACTTLYEQFLALGNGKLAMANMSFVRNLEIPVPNVDEQKRILSILERFEKYCEDIEEGIPAEIDARKKQYEFYRDKLLDLPKVGD